MERKGDSLSDAINLFTQIVLGAIPYGMAFALGNIVVNTFMRMAFGGRIEFR
jgi:hypothetical protein